MYGILQCVHCLSLWESELPHTTDVWFQKAKMAHNAELEV